MRQKGKIESHYNPKTRTDNDVSTELSSVEDEENERKMDRKLKSNEG